MKELEDGIGTVAIVPVVPEVPIVPAAAAQGFIDSIACVVDEI
jgi:hypothetical protein